MRNALFAVMGLLALSLVPVSGHAQMPGDKCGGDDQVVVGTTRMASDQQNIIACLKTGDTTPGANVSEWKAMTSGGGGGGVTGGCFAGTGTSLTGSWFRVSHSWGQGCSNKPTRVMDPSEYSMASQALGFDTCKLGEDAGYSCGISGLAGGNGWLCQCVKK